MKLLLPACFLLLIGLACPVFAQAPPPPGVPPPESMRASPDFELPTPDIEVQREGTVDKKMESAPPVPKEKKNEQRIAVGRFLIKGNRIFSSETLLFLVRDYLYRPITLSEIYEAADKITKYYVDNGYSLALTTVPAQRVNKGTITFEVLEGRIGRVYPEDNTLYSSADIMAHLRGINSDEAYSAQPLESALLELNSLPGLKTKAVLKPGDFYGRSDIVIKTQEKPVAAALSVDNYGREANGRIRTTLAAQINNSFGLADQIQAVGLISESGLLKYNSLGYNLAPAVGGPRLFLNYGQADFEVAGSPVAGRSRNGRVNLEQPLRRTRNETLNVGIGGTRILSNINLAGAPINATGITYFDISGAYNILGEKGGVTQMSLALISNFDDQDASDCTPGNAACTGIAAKVDLNLLRLQPLANRLDLLLRVNAAYSAEPLPESVQFGIGGPGSIRAYPSAEARGESGYAAGADFRFAVLTAPVGMTARVFGDYGVVHRADASDRTLPDDTALGAVGVGFDFGYTEHFTARVDVAWPTITKSSSTPTLPSENDGGHSLYASVGFNF